MQLDLNEKTRQFYEECITKCNEVIKNFEDGIYKKDFKTKEVSDYLLDKFKWLKDYFESNEYDLLDMNAEVLEIYGFLHGYEFGYKKFESSKADKDLVDMIDWMYFKIGCLLGNNYLMVNGKRVAI